MAVNRRNLIMYRGDSLPFEVTVLNAGSAIDVTGYQFRMTAKYSVTDADVDAVFSITSPGNIQLTDPTNGTILVTIPPSATNLLESYPYYLFYDIQMYNDPGTIYTVCNGILNVVPDVSSTTP